MTTKQSFFSELLELPLGTRAIPLGVLAIDER